MIDRLLVEIDVRLSWVVVLLITFTPIGSTLCLYNYFYIKRVPITSTSHGDFYVLNASNAMTRPDAVPTRIWLHRGRTAKQVKTSSFL